MDFTNINHIRRMIANMPWTSMVVLTVLAVLAVAGACIGIYVAIRTLLDARREKRERRLRRIARRGSLAGKS